jgi:4'-phosphopantetheinyl transferase
MSRVEVWNFATSVPPVREVLAPYVGCLAAHVRIARTNRGKPFVPALASLGFSYSHAGDRSMVAVNLRGNVGVDIEQADAASARLDGLTHFFTASEQRLLDAMDARDRRLAVARLWTAKEALLKATGEGIDDSLRRLDVSAILGRRPVRTERPVFGESATRVWTVVSLDAEPGYAGSLAVEGAATPLVAPRNWPAAA